MFPEIMVRHQDTKWPHQVKQPNRESEVFSHPDSRPGAAGLYADSQRPTGSSEGVTSSHGL